MQYIEFVKVDSGDGFPETLFPLRNGPADPLPGINIHWWEIDSAELPARYFGSVPDGADLSAPGVLRVIAADDWQVLNASRRDALIKSIDYEAGIARLSFVSAGQLIEQEYRLAVDEVIKWRAAGSPADAVPESVRSGADYSQITNEAAAAEIEQIAADWDGVLLTIRSLRLAGKRSVRECSDMEMGGLADECINRLKALRPVS